MNEPREQVALLVSDSRPQLELTSSLARSGYTVRSVYSIDAAAHSLNRLVPALVVAGPLRVTTGLEFLLLKLNELAVDVIVVTEEPHISQLAERLGMQIRTPARKLALMERK